MSKDFLRSAGKVMGPLNRQIRLMVSRCVISLVNDALKLQQVQVELLAMPQADGSMGRETADDVEVIRQYGYAAHPHPGAEGVFVSVGGIRSHGLIIAIEDRRYRLGGLAEGEVAIYDDLGQKVYLTRSGIVVDGAGLPITLTNTPKVRMETPLVEATGDIVDHCDDTGRSMASMREVHDEHNHSLRNVQSGGSTLTTDTPNQQE